MRKFNPGSWWWKVKAEQLAVTPNRQKTQEILSKLAAVDDFQEAQELRAKADVLARRDQLAANVAPSNDPEAALRAKIAALG